MTVTASRLPTRASLAPAARLLVTTPALYVAFVVTAAITMPVSAGADLTQAQMSDVAPAWVAMSVLWAAPILVGAAAIALLGRALAPTSAHDLARSSTILAAVSAVSILVYLVLSVSLVGFDAARLGDETTHDVSTVASLLASWTALVATVLIAVALRRAGVLGRSGVVIAVLAGLYLIADVITWLPGLTGSVALPEAGGIPPFLISFLWCAFGVVLLRRRVSSEA